MSVQTEGIKTLSVYWSDTNHHQVSFNVIAAIQAIDFTIPPGFSIDISGEITVTVYNTIGGLWTNSETVYLETDDNSFGKMSATLSNSIAKFTVIFKTDGTKTLLISTESGTNKIAFAPVGNRIMKYSLALSTVLYI